MRFRRIFKNVKGHRWYPHYTLQEMSDRFWGRHSSDILRKVQETNEILGDMTYEEKYGKEELWCTMSFKKCPTKWTYPEVTATPWNPAPKFRPVRSPTMRFEGDKRHYYDRGQCKWMPIAGYEGGSND